VGVLEPDDRNAEPALGGLHRSGAAGGNECGLNGALAGLPELARVARVHHVHRGHHPRSRRLPAGDKVIEEVDHRVVALAVWILADHGRDNALRNIGHGVIGNVVADDRQLPGKACID